MTVPLTHRRLSLTAPWFQWPDSKRNRFRPGFGYPSEHAQIAHTLSSAHYHLMQCWESTPRLAVCRELGATTEWTSHNGCLLRQCATSTPLTKIFSLSVAARK